jgi:nicotinamidase-related amidase
LEADFIIPNQLIRKRMKALLIIDMQKGLFIPETPRYAATNVIKRINNLANLFREKDLPIIFIQHNGSSQGEYLPNTEEWELLDELIVKENDYIIEKYANDSFYNSDLENELNKLNIIELYITGCATDFCVNSTIQSAFVKNYQITVVSDGHTTTDRPGLSAEKIIDHYNWVWGNMIPINDRIKVKKTDLIINELIS